MQEQEQNQPIDMAIIPEIVDVLSPDVRVTKPPTADMCTYIAAQLLRGLASGKVTHQTAMGGAKIVDAIGRTHANKLLALKYTGKPAPKSLLKELSLDV